MSSFPRDVACPANDGVQVLYRKNEGTPEGLYL